MSKGLSNFLIAEYDGPTPLKPDLAIGYDPETIPSIYFQFS